MYAYRWKDVDNERPRLNENYDDDGETKAGKRLLYLLELMDVYNVLIIVQRWYGGVQLGADRFKHITQVAQSLLKECSLDPRSSSGKR
jgi:putative IMPACT (imprinted ancient) family translation regulator